MSSSEFGFLSGKGRHIQDLLVVMVTYDFLLQCVAGSYHSPLHDMRIMLLSKSEFMPMFIALTDLVWLGYDCFLSMRQCNTANGYERTNQILTYLRLCLSRCLSLSLSMYLYVSDCQSVFFVLSIPLSFSLSHAHTCAHAHVCARTTPHTHTHTHT